jgi:hypothetical protein
MFRDEPTLLELAGVGQLHAAAGKQGYAKDSSQLPHSKHLRSFCVLQWSICLRTLLRVI